MDRRQALKNIGMGAGFLVATPTIMSLLQSCENEPEFNTVFIAKNEGHALRHIVDLIIPSDENMPGAVDVGVHSFIDSFWNAVIPEEQQEHVRIGFRKLGEKFRSTFDKELEKGDAEEYDQLLQEYLLADKDAQKGFQEEMGNFYIAFAQDPTVEPDVDASVYSLLSNIRGSAIWAWKNSEEIGENVLWYDPVPGQQRGCITSGEAGFEGKAMSL
ncbi:gluconate 2-dehydrogenase subunit 3 family protein [Altibacter sp. HG106]|uniref:gluconate 2-dehydrogenase subunit 3 family protein n=1 Tax=Altibacter sp. HG106 TaxID=3023937 RepID=UPI002350888A|nr:gluconate 2-dehydrogenase subunit 3 family protein [Altibacter sp. HG106]MDC7994850.1 gluconate 2-dehydrogenase subunit 3 family protein [Altibacter sp. HG106]